MRIPKADLEKGYSTHMGILIKILQVSEGDVVELGAGPFSTPLLHWLCKDMDRRLISYENDEEFYNFAKRFQSRLHRIRFIDDWNQLDTKTHRGVVFIDHMPDSRRGTDTVRFKDSTDYIVLHDTDCPDIFGYENIWKHFKYIYTWKECRPWVSVVSNFKDLSKL